MYLFRDIESLFTYFYIRLAIWAKLGKGSSGRNVANDHNLNEQSNLQAADKIFARHTTKRHVTEVLNKTKR